MPVPKSVVMRQSPRRLLRDVVLERLLEAIDDGTLQPGERLLDDELVAWMDVSRTPIREAIAKLVEYGLVEMSANRWTRVAVPTIEQLREAFDVLFALARLGVDEAAGVPTRTQKAAIRKATTSFETHAPDNPRAAALAVIATVSPFVTESSSALVRDLGDALMPRVRFLTLAQPEGVNWGRVSLSPIDSALERQDAAALDAALQGLASDIRLVLSGE